LKGELDATLEWAKSHNSIPSFSVQPSKIIRGIGLLARQQGFTALFLTFVICFTSTGVLAKWENKSAAEIYGSACSSCHGFDGKGLPQSHVGFEDPLPDFTDCNFATREPDADWVAVAHEGGPVRGFSPMMPSFGGALTVEELELAISHIRTFCPDETWPRGELNFPRALFTEKAFPEDETVLTSSFPLEGAGFFQNELVVEKRFGARSQFELAVPFGWKEDGDWNGGIGDIGMGVKHVIADSLESGSILSLTGELKLPSGNREKGFGKGAVMFEPFLSFGQALPSELFLHAQGGVEISSDKEKADDEGFWRFALGRSFSQGEWGRSWSPMLEVLGTKEFESGSKIEWDLVPQIQIALNTRQHIMLNVGVRLPVTDTSHRQTAVLFYLFWEWFDGGLKEGW
jgi:hypothetical protein